jgi:hypothetical protein
MSSLQSPDLLCRLQRQRGRGGKSRTDGGDGVSSGVDWIVRAATAPNAGGHARVVLIAPTIARRNEIMSGMDPQQCPLCGKSNACGIAAGKSSCWCFTTEIPQDVKDRVPEEARDLACVCQACAERVSAEQNDQKGLTDRK